jgi:hypothetical protein
VKTFFFQFNLFLRILTITQNIQNTSPTLENSRSFSMIGSVFQNFAFFRKLASILNFLGPAIFKRTRGSLMFLETGCQLVVIFAFLKSTLKKSLLHYLNPPCMCKRSKHVYHQIHHRSVFFGTEHVHICFERIHRIITMGSTFKTFSKNLSFWLKDLITKISAALGPEFRPAVRTPVCKIVRINRRFSGCSV